jgi:uncharacterized membrane protein
VVLVSYPVSMVLLGLLAGFTGGTVSPPAMYWGALSGVCQGLGVWWLYAALGSGPIAVVAPLTAVLAAAVPLGVGVALGERPGPIGALGVVVAMVAVVLPPLTDALRAAGVPGAGGEEPPSLLSKEETRPLKLPNMSVPGTRTRRELMRCSPHRHRHWRGQAQNLYRRFRPQCADRF